MTLLETRYENEQALLHQYMVAHTMEPVMCKVFGCGKSLTPEEALSGDLCTQCSGKKKTDIMDVLKFE